MSEPHSPPTGDSNASDRSQEEQPREAQPRNDQRRSRLGRWLNNRWAPRLAGLALAVYWIALFVGTHIPVNVQFVWSWTDKLIHGGAYFGLAALLTAWSVLSGKSWRPWVIAAALSAYGIADELLQIPVGRHADVSDWLADTLGAVTGVGVAWSLLKSLGVLPKQKEPSVETLD